MPPYCITPFIRYLLVYTPLGMLRQCVYASLCLVCLQRLKAREPHITYSGVIQQQSAWAVFSCVLDVKSEGLIVIHNALRKFTAAMFMHHCSFQKASCTSFAFSGMPFNTLLHLPLAGWKATLFFCKSHMHTCTNAVIGHPHLAVTVVKQLQAIML